MNKINRHQAIKLLSAQKVYDSMPDEDLFNKDTGNYYTIYDILTTLDVSKEEVDFVQNLKHKELSLLD